MDLNEEIRNGYTISSKMKKVWAVQMELLKKLLEVCEKHHLRIWADGGTLLGTIREHGYIPWDDDIDMAMLRKDYDQLLEIAKDEFQSPFFFQSGYTEDNYPRGHAQLRKDGTAAINRYDIFQNFHQGIFIDVFVYDEVPDDKQELDSFINQIDKNLKDLKLFCDYKFSFLHPLISIQNYLIYHSIDKKGFHNAFKNFDELLKSKHGENVACVGFSLELNRFLRKKSLYENTVLLPFEDMMMPVPSGYDAILRTQYGDYMKPIKDPSYHGGFVALDTEKSYTEYIHQIRKDEINKRKMRVFNRMTAFFNCK